VGWVALFLSYIVTYLHDKFFDHFPIVIDTTPVEDGHKRLKRRRFEMMWVDEELRDKIMEESWVSDASMQS